MEKIYAAYILTNYCETTFYTGVTNDITRRIYEHKNGLIEGFTKQYNLKKLVYYTFFGTIEEAIYREKQLKKWKHQSKINLINKFNPEWQDLSLEWE